MPKVTRRRGDLRGKLEDYEADVLRNLTLEMNSLLTEAESGDAALARLFPDAYEKDDDARAYRELVRDELETAKLKAIKLVRDKLGAEGEVTLTFSDEEVDAWLALLTDMRLAIGTRLDVTEEKMNADVDPNDPEGAAMSVLHWLGWLQESSLRHIGRWGP
jgi:hypothetical protein